MRSMRTYERARDRASRRARRFLVQVGEEIRRLRRRAGLSQAGLGTLVGISQSHVSRIEAGQVLPLSIMLAARLLATVGAELSVRAFAAAIPLHDAAQLRILDRLRAILHSSLRLKTEVTLGIPGDARAFDAVVIGPGILAAFEVVARIEDVQALERALNLKRRDGGVSVLILVVGDTRHNRAVIALAPGLREAFPTSARTVLADLRAGRQPTGSAILFL